MTGKEEKLNLEQAHLDFISTVSHELRTPLTSIKGFADTMLNSYDKIPDEQKKKFLMIIKEQSNRLIKLTENLLAVSKLQQGAESLVLKSVEVGAAVDRAIKIVQNRYKNRSFVVKNNVFHLQSLFVLADEDKFEQILINLIENAAKYSSEHTDITIEIGQSSNPDLALVKVKNTGEPIKKEDYEKIFEKFSRLDSPLTRRTQGSGLGLFITKNLVQMMNGKITVEGEEKKTIFTVMLPLSGFDSQSARIIQGKSKHV